MVSMGKNQEQNPHYHKIHLENCKTCQKVRFVLSIVVCPNQSFLVRAKVQQKVYWSLSLKLKEDKDIVTKLQLQ